MLSADRTSPVVCQEEWVCERVVLHAVAGDASQVPPTGEASSQHRFSWLSSSEEPPAAPYRPMETQATQHPPATQLQSHVAF